MHTMSRRACLRLSVVLASSLLTGFKFPPPHGPEVTVYHGLGCGCCARWVDHLRQNGFTVVIHEVDDMAAIRQRLGVPPELRSCHTSVVQGYVVEGHVPARSIAAFLRDRPSAAGLAVPGMPRGAPGMEGEPAERYDVLAFQKDGSTRVYSTP